MLTLIFPLSAGRRPKEGEIVDSSDEEGGAPQGEGGDGERKKRKKDGKRELRKSDKMKLGRNDYVRSITRDTLTVDGTAE